MRADYYRMLFLAWTVRLVLGTSVVAILAMTSCTHQLKLSTDSSGSLHKDPPGETTPAN